MHGLGAKLAWGFSELVVVIVSIVYINWCTCMYVMRLPLGVNIAYQECRHNMRTTWYRVSHKAWLKVASISQLFHIMEGEPTLVYEGN